MDQPTPGLFRNYISWVGAALAIFGLGCTIFLALIDLWTKRPNPYLGIFAYVIFPIFLILGLILIPLGCSGKDGGGERLLLRRFCPIRGSTSTTFATGASSASSLASPC
jgi:hypothetical protein